MSERILSDLVQMQEPESVYNEAETTLKMVSGFCIGPVRSSFDLASALYNGKYPGYQTCSTLYHDFNHTTGVFLCAARIFHGYRPI